MKSIEKASEPMSSMLARLDDTYMNEHERELAKAYLRKTDAVLEVIWLAGTGIRAAIGRGLGMRSKPVLE